MKKIEAAASAQQMTVTEFLRDFLRGRTIRQAAERIGVGESTLKQALRRAGVRQDAAQSRVARRRGLIAAYRKKELNGI